MKKIINLLELASTFAGLLLWLIGPPDLQTILNGFQWVLLVLILGIALFGFWLGVMILIAQRQPPYE